MDELKNKPGWLETLWNVNPGLAERAEKELIETRNFAIEVVMKARLSFPLTEQESVWFDEGMNPKSGIKIIDTLKSWNPENFELYLENLIEKSGL